MTSTVLWNSSPNTRISAATSSSLSVDTTRGSTPGKLQSGRRLAAEDAGATNTLCQGVRKHREQVRHPGPVRGGKVGRDSLVDHERVDAGHGREVVAHGDPLARSGLHGVAIAAPDQ